jgi:hypothetical protein
MFKKLIFALLVSVVVHARAQETRDPVREYEPDEFVNPGPGDHAREDPDLDVPP